jgi:hypothetical protein
MKYILPVLITIAALAISGSAAFYSVSGLSKLFAGATIPVIIMAASLEFSKLVTASLLYRYWSDLNRLLRVYLIAAVFVLILITSLGIYGFLTAAYQTTANTLASTELQTNLYQTQREGLDLQIRELQQERSELIVSISGLRTGLTNNVVSYTDVNGNRVTTTSNATRVALEKQLSKSDLRLTELNDKLESMYLERSKLETEYTLRLSEQAIAGELGPLQFIGNLTNYSLDSIVNFLVLVIVFVFDPLAIALVVAANFAWKQLEVVKDSSESLDSILESAMESLTEDFSQSNRASSMEEFETLDTTVSSQSTAAAVTDTRSDVSFEPQTVAEPNYPSRNAPAAAIKKSKIDSIRYL